MTTVYVTHGRKYHTQPTCSALEMGQALHDYDCDCWGYCEHGKAWSVVEVTAAAARAAGWRPCRRCYPEGDGFRPSEDHFGHEPTVCIANGKYRATECYRCRIYWPCTSAIVLGLAPRTAA